MPLPDLVCNCEPEVLSIPIDAAPKLKEKHRDGRLVATSGVEFPLRAEKTVLAPV